METTEIFAPKWVNMIDVVRDAGAAGETFGQPVEVEDLHMVGPAGGCLAPGSPLTTDFGCHLFRMTFSVGFIVDQTTVLIFGAPSFYGIVTAGDALTTFGVSKGDMALLAWLSGEIVLEVAFQCLYAANYGMQPSAL
jgi:hypothetical protein